MSGRFCRPRRVNSTVRTARRPGSGAGSAKSSGTSAKPSYCRRAQRTDARLVHSDASVWANALRSAPDQNNYFNFIWRHAHAELQEDARLAVEG